MLAILGRSMMIATGQRDQSEADRYRSRRGDVSWSEAEPGLFRRLRWSRDD